MSAPRPAHELLEHPTLGPGRLCSCGVVCPCITTPGQRAWLSVHSTHLDTQENR